jgi:D-alanine transaminase
MSQVYLNGCWIPADEARVSVNDRGFLFADGLYEVTPAYRGRFLAMDRHEARIRGGLAALRIEWSTDDYQKIHARLLAENGLEGAPAAIVYVQVTRGVAPRAHPFPVPAPEPTVYAFAREWDRPTGDAWAEGGRAVTTPDLRWARCDIKSIVLLPNVLAQQAASDAGATDAILIRDGIAIEGAHSNLWMVKDGVAITHPATERILHGITRGLVLELAPGAGVTVEQRPMSLDELRDADEVFMTGTTTEVRPILEVDGSPVGEGVAGPVTRRLFEAFEGRIAEL